MEEQTATDLEKFFYRVAKFMAVNHPGQQVRAMVLMECETGEFRVQTMYNNDIWFRGMIDTASTIDKAKIHLNVINSAEETAEAMKRQDLMAAEVPGKAQ